MSTMAFSTTTKHKHNIWQLVFIKSEVSSATIYYYFSCLESLASCFGGVVEEIKLGPTEHFTISKQQNPQSKRF